MPDRLDLTLYPIKPSRTFIKILALSFTAELSVMCALPAILPEDSPPLTAALVDAILLTAVVAPVIWYSLVRPIQQLSLSRIRFLRRSMLTEVNERRRIKQELHDELGQNLTSMLLGLRAIEESSSEPRICEIASQMRSIGSEIHSDLHRIITGLHPTVLEHGGLVAAVDALIDEYHMISQTKIVQVSNIGGRRFELGFESLVYRIIQESLNNAIKHAQASEIRIEVNLDDQTLNVNVTDNGRGFAPRLTTSHQHSYGLIGIRERALAVGGSIEITSSRAGTCVRGELPTEKSEGPTREQDPYFLSRRPYTRSLRPEAATDYSG